MSNQATEKQVEFINTLIRQQIDNLNKLSLVPSDETMMLLWQPPAEGMIEYIESWLSLDFSTFTKSEASELIDFLKDPIASHHVEVFAREFAGGVYYLTAEQAERNNRRHDVDYYVEGENLTGIHVILVKIARMLPAPAPAPALTIVEAQDPTVTFNEGEVAGEEELIPAGVIIWEEGWDGCDCVFVTHFDTRARAIEASVVDYQSVSRHRNGERELIALYDDGENVVLMGVDEEGWCRNVTYYVTKTAVKEVIPAPPEDEISYLNKVVLHNHIRF